MEYSQQNSIVIHRHWPVISVWIGALIFCIPAFLNGYPFLYADTGTYLMGGFRDAVSEIRAITYGLFLRHISLNESVWLVIFVQALLTSWLMHTFYRVFSSKPLGMRPVVSIMILTLLTGVGEVVGMLMPDFLAAIMILCGMILLYGSRLPVWKLILICLLLWLSVASHHSNGYIFFLLLFGVAFFRLVHYSKSKEFLYSWKRFFLATAIAVAGFFTIPILHYIYSHDFFWSKTKYVFLTNRVNQIGMLKPFLNEYCATKDYRLCPYKDNIPIDFLWSPDSPMSKTGGMAANDAEYGRMLSDFFSDPYYLKKFIARSVENIVIQFFTIEGQLIFQETEKGYPVKVFQEVWPEQYPPIWRSHQHWDRHEWKMGQVFQRFMVNASYLFFIAFFVYLRGRHFTKTQQYLTAFLFLALLANAAVCAGISMVDMRFQNRIVWLVPFLAIWLITEHNLLKISRLQEIFSSKATAP